MSSTVNKLLVILGPTASGKTKLAAQLAARLNGEIISADSRQVYRKMNVGTGKDYSDYLVQGQQIAHHLVDIADAGDKYNLHRFMADFENAVEQIYGRSKLPVLCGGTGLYLQAALSDLSFSAVPIDDALREELSLHDLPTLRQVFSELPQAPYTALADLSTVKRCIRAIEICRYLNQNPGYSVNSRMRFNHFIIGLNPPLEIRRQQIQSRLALRLKQGLVEEVQQLLRDGMGPEMLDYYGLEYRFVARYLAGEIQYRQLEELLTVAIQQYARRQMTFFRKMEKDGLKIHWLNGNFSLDEKLALSLQLLSTGF